jgi:hypothetical protein
MYGKMGRDSSVGIATRYGLDGPGIESRYGARFSAPVQTGPESHPASCKLGTGSFPGVKSGRGVRLTPHPLIVRRSWKSRAIPLHALWAVRPVQSLSAGTRLHFTLTEKFSRRSRDLRGGTAVSLLLRLRVRILPEGMNVYLVSVVWCQVEVSASGRSPCRVVLQSVVCLTEYDHESPLMGGRDPEWVEMPQQKRSTFLKATP